MAIKQSNKIWPFILSGFFLILISSCTPKEELSYSINWDNQKAVSVVFPKSLVESADNNNLSIHLQGREQEVLGDWKTESGEITFKPIVPFNQGEKYALQDGEKVLLSFSIKEIKSTSSEVLAIYPTSDTLPSNILKMYIRFSKPMSTGNSLDYISVLHMDSGDTLEATFLNLQPELWNQDNTLLTLWLDPGRIKRGLIPNEELGAPLEEYQNYRLTISNKWEDSQGNPIQDPVAKEIYTVARDELKIEPEKWVLELPQTETSDPLRISFSEPLDAILINESIDVLNSEKSKITGEFQIDKNEMGLRFYPDSFWDKGVYYVLIETRLEDLAGNNLNRLFDQEINDSDKEETEYVELKFYIN